MTLARFVAPSSEVFEFDSEDRQALVALLGFLVGAALGQLSDRLNIGPRSRAWLLLGTLIQALMTLISAITLLGGKFLDVTKSPDDPGLGWVTPLGYVGLTFIRASVGLQAIMGKKIASHFSTTGT
jgi:hypothetical protein